MSGGKNLTMVLIYILVVSMFLGIALIGNEVTSVIAEHTPVIRTNTIIIDAGHGGEDGGATSCSGRQESIYNLEISLKFRDLLQLLGCKTLMIRTKDESVYKEGSTIAAKKVSDLKERVRIVNEREGAILVSIHQNMFPDGQYHGAQVFYGPKGESQALAEAMQQALRDTVNPGSNRKIKKADGIYLMQQIRCTGILVECGFLSNPQEEALLRTDAYQQKLVCVMAGTLSQFLTDRSSTAIIKEK